MAPTVVAFSPSFLLMVLLLIPALQVYSLVPDILQLFGLAHGGGEVGMEDTYSVDRCILYTLRADIRSTF